MEKLEPRALIRALEIDKSSGIPPLVSLQGGKFLRAPASRLPRGHPSDVWSACCSPSAPGISMKTRPPLGGVMIPSTKLMGSSRPGKDCIPQHLRHSQRGSSRLGHASGRCFLPAVAHRSYPLPHASSQRPGWQTVAFRATDVVPVVAWRDGTTRWISLHAPRSNRAVGRGFSTCWTGVCRDSRHASTPLSHHMAGDGRVCWADLSPPSRPLRPAW
jgi:hypothetical protein